MSRLTDAFDRWIEIHNEEGAALTPNPGASEEVIDQAEEIVGFKFAAEVRELYAHANGIATAPGRRWPIFPSSAYFNPLEIHWDYQKLEAERLPSYVASEDLPRWGPGGTPVHSVSVFSGPGGEVSVECSEHAHGAVGFFHGEEGWFGWLTRSLTDLFERHLVAYELGEMSWDEDWVRVHVSNQATWMIDFRDDRTGRHDFSYRWDD